MPDGYAVVRGGSASPLFGVQGSPSSDAAEEPADSPAQQPDERRASPRTRACAGRAHSSEPAVCPSADEPHDAQLMSGNKTRAALSPPQRGMPDLRCYTHEQLTTFIESKICDGILEASDVEAFLASASAPSSFGQLQSGTARIGLPVLVLPGAERAGCGRGGGIPLSTKVAVRDMVTEAHVPVSRVAHVWAIVQAALTGELPAEEALFTSRHVSDWIVQMSSAEFLESINAFWEVRKKYPDVKLHIHHDATERPAREIGKHAKLTAYLASYFDPDEQRARALLLSLRPLPGSGGDALIS